MNYFKNVPIPVLELNNFTTNAIGAKREREEVEKNLKLIGEYNLLYLKEKVWLKLP